MERDGKTGVPTARRGLGPVDLVDRGVTNPRWTMPVAGDAIEGESTLMGSASSLDHRRVLPVAPRDASREGDVRKQVND